MYIFADTIANDWQWNGLCFVCEVCGFVSVFKVCVVIFLSSVLVSESVHCVCCTCAVAMCCCSVLLQSALRLQ